MHFDGKMIWSVMLGALIAIVVFTLILETPVKKLASKIPFNA